MAENTLKATGRVTDEGRPVFIDPSGGLVTEKTVTTDIFGQFFNVPTVYDGRIVSEDEARQRAIDARLTDPITGRKLTGFKSIDEAVLSAKNRSAEIGKKLQANQGGNVNNPDIPEGFVIESSPQQIPEGFVVESEAQPAGGPISGAIETAAAIGSGVAGEVLGGALGAGAEMLRQTDVPFSAAVPQLQGLDLVRRGLKAMGIEIPEGADVVRAIQEGLFREPQTVSGQEQLQAVGEALQFISEPLQAAEQKLGDVAFETTGSPTVAAAATTVPTLALEAISAPLAGLRGGVRQSTRFADQAQDVPTDVVPPAAEVPTTAAPATAAEREGVESALRGRDEAALVEQVSPDAQILSDANALGVDLNPSHYSTNQAFIEVEQAIKSRPESKLSTRERKAIEDLGTRADELITELGGTTDKSFLDADLRNEFTTNIDNLTAQSDVLYKKVEDAIPTRAKVKPLASRNYIEQKLADLGGDESLLSTAERQLLRIVSDQSNPTYAALDRLRKNVGQGFSKNTGPFKDDGEGILRQVYAALSRDQQGVAQVFGVGDEYAAARNLVSTRKDLEDNARTVFGRDLNRSIIPQLRQAGNNLSKGDLAKFRQIMESVPESRRADVAASMLNDLFIGAGRGQTGVSQSFVTVFDNLARNKEAKNELFKILGTDARKRFDQIGRVARGIFRAKSAENTSNTARAVLENLERGGFLSKAAEVGKEVAKAEGVTTATGVPGAGTGFAVGSYLTGKRTPAAEAAEEMLTSDAFNAAIRRSSTSLDEANQIIANSPEYRAWTEFLDENTVSNIAAVGILQWLAEEDNGTQR